MFVTSSNCSLLCCWSKNFWGTVHGQIFSLLNVQLLTVFYLQRTSKAIETGINLWLMDICLFHKDHICKIIPVYIALRAFTAFLACSLCSKCSGNTNYNGCTAVLLYCTYLQCTRARVLNPVGTRVSSVQMTLFGRLSFFPFLHLLNLSGAIHKSKVQGVFQTEYELPLTVNIFKMRIWLFTIYYNQLVITGLLAKAWWHLTTNSGKSSRFSWLITIACMLSPII